MRGQIPPFPQANAWQQGIVQGGQVHGLRNWAVGLIVILKPGIQMNFFAGSMP